MTTPRALWRVVIVGVAFTCASAFAAGCVAVPDSVKAEFADDDGARPNHYRLRPEAERAAAERAVFERAAAATPDPEATATAATPTAKGRS